MMPRLVFDNINLWIPRDVKQLALLPLEESVKIGYPLVCAEDAEKVTKVVH